jgi:hypothetical protein
MLYFVGDDIKIALGFRSCFVSLETVLSAADKGKDTALRLRLRIIPR